MYVGIKLYKGENFGIWGKGGNKNKLGG